MNNFRCYFDGILYDFYSILHKLGEGVQFLCPRAFILTIELIWCTACGEINLLITLNNCEKLENIRSVNTFSFMQAFDAPWPIIQANAIYFSSSMLSRTDDQRILALYYSQVIS